MTIGVMSTYTVSLLIVLAACGCASTRTDTIVIKPDSGWDTVDSKTSVELSQRRDVVSDEQLSRSALGSKQDLSMGGAIAVRQDLARLAANYSLIERPASRGEVAAGFTEAFGRSDGTALLIGENPANRYVNVRITGPATDDVRELRETVRQRYAPPPPPDAKENPTEAFRRAYNLPGRQKVR